MTIFVLLFRFLIGLLFVVSGFEKLIGPYQNFLYIVQSYDCLPPILEEVTARVVPWIELFVGLFLVLGLWVKLALRGTLILFTSFIIIVSQAIVRDLPITECGCFGELASFPLYVVLIFDAVMFAITFVLLKKIDATLKYSLDHYFGQS